MGNLYNLLICSIAAAFVSACFLDGGSLDLPVQQNVPNVVNQTEEAATTILTEFNVVLDPAVYDDAVLAGSVVSQDPVACNACALPGTTVTLTLSLGPIPIETGLQTMESNGVERSYYVVLPEEDPTNTPEPVPPSTESDPKPLIIGFHGSFASHQSWVGENERYGFVDEVGDGAIMVFPDALALADGQVN
jgi:hypothetical protein